MVQGRDDRARGGEGVGTGQPMEAVEQSRLARVARQIAHPRVGQRDDVRAERRQGMHRGGQGVEVAERALLHALGGTRVTGHGLEPREVDRHGRRRHPVQLRLDGRVAGGHEHAETRARRHHGLDASRPSDGKSRRLADPVEEASRGVRLSAWPALHSDSRSDKIEKGGFGRARDHGANFPDRTLATTTLANSTAAGWSDSGGSAAGGVRGTWCRENGASEVPMGG